MSASDLTVDVLSDALAGKTLDVVVSGSIGAVESVRFLRALRRLGADVVPWLTDGGARFVTELALSWAAARPTRRDFSGDASHIATGDAVIVAPASASLIGRVARGFTNTPAAALITSYFGAGRPVILVPSMHGSLANAPAVLENLETLVSWGASIAPAREEEGKRKFPDPESLADFAAHVINAKAHPGHAALITMGTTRGYVDDVRYLSNYSSGALGSLIAEELYRQGIATQVVLGPCPVTPRIATRIRPVQTTAEMEREALAALAEGARAAVLAASVLDYEPKTRTQGKIRSGATGLTIELVPTRKIIAAVDAKVKVGFKLETGLTEARAREVAEDYMKRYALSMMVLNDLADVDRTRHAAYVTESAEGALSPLSRVEGKQEVARRVAAHVAKRLLGGKA